MNTDFAEVEVDVQQINLDRFTLFFPEKRPFFLENAGNFNFGIPRQVELFFSRRIGIGARGQVIPIDGGLRLSGKAGRNNIGVLFMQTDEVSGAATENHFGVTRLSRELAENSSVGMIFTNREGEGPDNYGRTFGIDGRWAVNPTTEVKGFVAKTDTPGAGNEDHSYYVGSRWNTKKIVAELSYAEVGEDFDPQVGFLTRRGYRPFTGDGEVRRPAGSGPQQHQPAGGRLRDQPEPPEAGLRFHPEGLRPDPPAIQRSHRPLVLHVRFGWRETASTDFFLVFNDTEEIGRGNFEPQRQVILKYSHTFETLNR